MPKAFEASANRKKGRRISYSGDNRKMHDSPHPGRGPGMQSDERVWREAGLRSAVLAGDETAWRAWYEETFPSLYAYAHWRCAGLRDLTEEIVQETWLTAVRRLRDFRPEQGSFAAWLRGIVANLLRNHWRHAHPRNGTVDRLGDQHPFSPPADAALEQRERAEQIARALAQLADRQEAVLRAKYLDGRSVADIAAEWGESPKAVESLLTRARQAFREAYQPHE
jgi:RNA polymerase sigma-70 factor (ECF subfamily)